MIEHMILLWQAQHMLGHELQQAVDQPAEVAQQEYDMNNTPEVFMPANKMCSKCKAIKPSDQFFRDKSKPDRLYSQVRPARQKDSECKVQR